MGTSKGEGGMKLIIGGSYQGKRAYARREFGIEEGWADGKTCELMDITACRGIDHFHEYVRRLLERERKALFWSDGMISLRFYSGDLVFQEEQADVFADWLYSKNPDLVIVTNELGCGIVPADLDGRLWRETAGRICTSLAAKADTMVRVCCGIGTRIK